MATITVSDNTTGSTVGGIEDNELTGFNTTQQLGTAVQAYIDAWQGPDVFVTFVMRIPIPSGSGTVSNAKLRLYMTEKGGVKTALSLYEILRTDWSESQSTYNIYKTSNNWTSGGAQGAGTDRSSSAIATCNVSGTSVNNYIEFTGSGLTALIQSAVDGAISSINVIVQFTDLSFTSQNYVRFRTSEGTDGQRPQLVYDLTSSDINVALTGIGNTYSAGSIGSSTTKALTGIAQTASQGTLVTVHSKALTTNAVTASQGALASAIALALSGQAFTYSQGTVTPNTTSNINVALTGQQYAFAQGSLSASTSKALTGQQATETAGNLTGSVSKAITGQGGTFASGSLGSSVTATLIGGSSVYSQGTVSPTGTINIQITGSTFTYSAGNLTASSSKAISGQSATLSQGTLAGLIARALSGQSHTVSQGTLTPSNAIQIQLTGEQVSYAQGYLTGSLSKQLIGSSATYVQGTISVFGQVIPQYPLEGSVITYPISASVDYPLAGNNPNYPLGT